MSSRHAEGALDVGRDATHTIHMKRTNLVLDESLLKEAVSLSGAKTFSMTVDLALHDYVRRAKAKRIFELAGSGLWEGDLAAMRGDAPRRARAARRRR